MALGFNKVIIAGNLTRDPQVRFLANEQAVANFGIALNRKYKSGGETKEEVVFVDVEAWGKTAELAGQYLTKGRPVLVEGRLKLDQWEDKDGQKRQKLKVVADGLTFLGTGEKNDAGPGPDQSEPRPSRPAPAAAGNDEPPF